MLMFIEPNMDILTLSGAQYWGLIKFMLMFIEPNMDILTLSGAQYWGLIKFMLMSIECARLGPLVVRE